MGGARRGECQEQGSRGGVAVPISLQGARRGVKSWLEDGKRGRIGGVDPGNTPGCQSRSCLPCSVTMSAGAGASRLEKPGFCLLIWLMKNAAAPCRRHGIGFSSEFSGLVPGEGRIHPQPAPCEGRDGGSWVSPAHPWPTSLSHSSSPSSPSPHSPARAPGVTQGMFPLFSQAVLLKEPHK